MKKIWITAFWMALGIVAYAQSPHIYEHDYPIVTTEDPQIRSLMDAVSADSIEANIEHLSSYHTRRYDSRFIWDVQDWLVRYYQKLDVDMVMLHNFPVPDSDIETADNILAVKWGTTKPDEFVICGAHYDSWNSDGSDPDTIRSPGADDNASGVAGILETARLLSPYKFERSIIFATWNAEEIGLVGSAAYAHDMAEQGMDIVAYFNLDMTGYLAEGSDIHVNLMYTTRDSLLGDYVKSFSRTYFPEMRIWQDWLAWGDSDYSSFNRNGYAAIHPFEDTHASSPFIHTRQDVLGLSVNNLEQSKRFTELNLGTVALLAGLQPTSASEYKTLNVALYPNPTHDAVNLWAEDGLQKVVLNNLMGQQTKVMTLDGENRCVINTTDLPSGIYIVTVVTSQGTTTQRLVVY